VAVLQLLEYQMVEHEDDLGYVGETVKESAKTRGTLNLAQINCLEEWVSAVQRRMQGGPRSSQDILYDPVAAKAEEDSLNARVGLAVSEAAAATGDPETQRKAKAKAALAMYRLSMKKRHFKGLRPEEDVLVPPAPWGFGGRRMGDDGSGTTF